MLAKLSQVKAMTLLADRRGVTLQAQEEKLVQEAAAAYLESLSDTEKEALGVTQELAEGCTGITRWRIRCTGKSSGYQSGDQR